MECPNCGSTIMDDAKFCSLCFTKFDTSNPALGLQPIPAGLTVGGSFAEAPSVTAGAFSAESDLPAQIPPEELAQIRSFSAPTPGLPLTRVREDATTGRKVAVVAGGSILSVVLGYMLSYLSVPFIAFVAPFIAGAVVGYKLGDEGGKFGAIAAAIPAVLAGIFVLIVASAILPALTREAATQAGSQSSRIPASALSELVSNVLWFALAINVGGQTLAGFLGGRTGESYSGRF